MTERIGMQASVDLKVVILDVGHPELRRYHVLQFDLWRPWPYQAKRSEANQTNKPLMQISRKQDLRSMKTLLESVLITAAAGTEPVENSIVRCKR